MAQVVPGRCTAQTDDPFVVFLIGMRVNRIFAFRKWIPTALAMGPMLRTLYQHPEKGFVGAQSFFYWRGVALVQYWRSLEDLERFARDQGDSHFPAMRRFNQAVGYKDGAVGPLRSGLWQYACLRPGRRDWPRPRGWPARARAPTGRRKPVRGASATDRVDPHTHVGVGAGSPP